jgi:hypothetical protein
MSESRCRKPAKSDRHNNNNINGWRWNNNNGTDGVPDLGGLCGRDVITRQTLDEKASLRAFTRTAGTMR